MARIWIIDGRGLANKVKCAALSPLKQIKDCGAIRECPNCHYIIDNINVPAEWPGLPLGVKFDPSDVQLLGHLAAKCGVGESKPHFFIDIFIPTLDGDDGICYTHPENLPGASKGGGSVHFFHRTSRAYATGRRKRRRVEGGSAAEETVRWHKTGKTKPVLENGSLKGSKKIMVLYGSSAGRRAVEPGGSNWVVHQYHLGRTGGDEDDSPYVLSKVFYQKQRNAFAHFVCGEEDTRPSALLRAGPKTPKPSRPNPPRPPPPPDPFSNPPYRAVGGGGGPERSAGAARADEFLLCDEIFDPLISSTAVPSSGHDVFPGDECYSSVFGATGLDDIDLADMQFDSQGNSFEWLGSL